MSRGNEPLEIDNAHLTEGNPDAILADEQLRISYFPRAFLLAALPYRKPVDKDGKPLTYIERQTPRVTVSFGMHQPTGFLPFGSLPRLFIAYATEQAIRTGSPIIELGHGITDLLKLFGMVSTGGGNGTASRLRRQLQAILNTTIRFEWRGNDNSENRVLFPIIERAVVWPRRFEVKRGDGLDIGLDSPYYFVLSTYFFNEINTRPVPVNFNAMKHLQRSPLAMDLYSFLTYRSSFMKRDRDTLLQWRDLQAQFVSQNLSPSTFKKRISQELVRVQSVYPQLRVDVLDGGLLIKRDSLPNIPRREALEIEKRPGVKVVDVPIHRIEEAPMPKPAKARSTGSAKPAAADPSASDPKSPAEPLFPKRKRGRPRKNPLPDEKNQKVRKEQKEDAPLQVMGSLFDELTKKD